MGVISLMDINENNSYSINSKCLLADFRFFCEEVATGQSGWRFDIAS
jgi:hypothetical protein